MPFNYCSLTIRQNIRFIFPPKFEFGGKDDLTNLARRKYPVGIISDISDKQLEQMINDILSDNPRPGTSVTFTPEQIVQIVAIACEDPGEASERPISHWTHKFSGIQKFYHICNKRIAIKLKGTILAIARTALG